MTAKPRSKPRYAELGDLLRSGIERGDYPVGSLLPTELELCERHEVSRHTARAALAQLMSAGLVSRRPGAGTRVIAQREAMRYEHGIDTVDMLMQYGNSTRLKVMSCTRKVADEAMATRLEMTKGKDYLHLVGLRLEEPTLDPIAVTEMFVPVRTGVPAEKMLDSHTASRAVARFLDASRLSRVEQVFDAASFTPDEAKLLGIKRNEPALRVQRRYRGTEDRLMMLAVSLHPPGRFAYSMVLSRTTR
ncbi:GntR family transcriptional regulator [Rhodanobacter sp. AS-Z3]|uniref:GntR family transcriptional regulator n=1 Tax=Rhodanobacter sp. AS-Z3 TaxID=3031330 RepID=UPI00247945B9|nr:GntR family transcriptional regulator [Rhodanobacter sp. AS-Z3]WEN14145.1 GntR family transcriptional regulator [Rhodanobacter sp. AS-Z3]